VTELLKLATVLIFCPQNWKAGVHGAGVEGLAAWFAIYVRTPRRWAFALRKSILECMCWKYSLIDPGKIEAQPQEAIVTSLGNRLSTHVEEICLRCGLLARAPNACKGAKS